MKFSLVIVIAILLGMIVQSVEGGGGSKCFAQICSGNPSNRIRGWDKYGSGAFGASRRGRNGIRYPHRGVDVICATGSDIYAPFPAKVLHTHRPYRNNNRPHNVGIHLIGTGEWQGYGVKLFYASKKANNGAYVSAGHLVGSMTNMAAEFHPRGMTNHVHVQIDRNGKILDPNDFIWSCLHVAYIYK